MIQPIIKTLIARARVHAREDMELERVERLAGVKLKTARAKAQGQVKRLSRQIDALMAAGHYRTEGKWKGGPVVPAKVKTIIRNGSDHRLETVMQMLDDADAWSDQVWK
jgi:hypothetical protein